MPDHQSAVSYFNPSTQSFVGLTNQWFWVSRINFYGNNQPVIAGQSGVAYYNGTQFLLFDQTNSPVWDSYGTNGRAMSASMDQWDNMIVADGEGGFMFHCGGKQSPVGISESEKTPGFSLAPNPSGGTFRIYGETSGNVKVRVCDTSGKLVYSQTHDFGEEISPELAEGLYFVSLVNEKGEKWTHKLIIAE